MSREESTAGSAGGEVEAGQCACAFFPSCIPLHRYLCRAGL
jgi:hypothetical protein